MHLILCTIGKLRGAGWQALNAEYLRRIGHYVRCDTLEFRSDTDLLRRWPRGDVNVTLEVLGQPVSSVEFARALERWGRQGKGRITLVVGGAEGLSPACLERADFRLSLSRMTLPHRLAQVLLLEQIYRAFTILRGEPYARED